jgi:uncharacterized protein YqgC (DUF456 family)
VSDPVQVTATIGAGLMMLVGLIGTILPVLPGTVLILAGAFLYALIDGFHVVGWPTLAVLGLMTVIGTSADLWASSIGAKMGGASGWSVLAGLMGGLAGLLIFSLPGAMLGAILSVVLIEIMRQNDWRKAVKAGSGWLVGWALSTIFQLGVGIGMIAIFLWQIALG